MGFTYKNFAFGIAQKSLGRTTLALLLAGAVTTGALYTVHAQDAPTVASPSPAPTPCAPASPAAPVAVAVTLQAPKGDTEEDQAIRRELDSLLRQRQNLDARISRLQSRLGNKELPYSRFFERTQPLTEEQHRRAEEAMRKAEEAMQRAEKALQDAEQAVPGGHSRFFAEPWPAIPFNGMPSITIPALPALPPMPDIKLWSPDGHTFNWNSNGWSDKDRAEWDKTLQEWNKKYAENWKAWAQEWEKKRPEFEKTMREYQEKMRQWQKEFQEQRKNKAKDDAGKSKDGADLTEPKEKEESDQDSGQTTTSSADVRPI